MLGRKGKGDRKRRGGGASGSGDLQEFGKKTKQTEQTREKGR